MANFQQLLQFVNLYLGYGMIIFVRKSFTYVLPDVVNSMGIERSQLGLVPSSQCIAYSISKFVGGIMADMYKPKLLLQSSLVASALTAFAFTGFNSIWMFSILWFLNGLVQGQSWPACAKILMAWFPPDNFATWWSILSTSINVAGSIGPILITTIALHYGWRLGMIIPASTALLLAASYSVTMHEDPLELGLESYLGKHSGHQTDPMRKKRNGISLSQIASVFQDPFLFLMGINYLILNSIRTCMMDWSQLYLIQEKQLSPILSSMVISGMEIGGIVGSILSGVWSDKAIRNSVSDSKAKCRLKVSWYFCLGLSLCLFLLVHHIRYYSNQTIVVLVGFGIGFFVYGPININGVIVLESVPAHMSGVSSSVVSAFGNAGGVIAGLPVTYLASFQGWHRTFIYANFLSLISLACLWKLSYMQCQLREDDTEEKTS